MGAKQEVASYLNISAQLHSPPKEILFLTDIEGEARAAIEAGMNVLLLVRGGEELPVQSTTNKKQQPDSQQRLLIPSVNNFNQIVFL